jgi:hypothetical protein
MAVRDGYVLALYPWGQIHWDWAARRIIETSYLEACFEHDGNDVLARQARELGDQIAHRYGVI